MKRPCLSEYERMSMNTSTQFGKSVENKLAIAKLRREMRRESDAIHKKLDELIEATKPKTKIGLI